MTLSLAIEAAEKLAPVCLAKPLMAVLSLPMCARFEWITSIDSRERKDADLPMTARFA